jgi:uncharacterized membrane protein YdbT with pleckstrin-like domain
MITLDQNEKILWQGTPSARVLATWFFSKIGGFLLFIVIMAFFLSPLLFSEKAGRFFPFLIAIGTFLLILAVLAFLYIIFLRRTYEYYITSNRVIFKGGILMKTLRSVPFHKVTDIETSQHVLEQVLAISKLNIFTAGTGSLRAEIIFSGLKNPGEPEQVLKNILKTYKSTGE